MDPLTYTPRPGQDISSAAYEMCHAATLTGKRHVGIFNDIRIEADPGSDPDAVTATWWATMNAKTAAYHASPEYKAQQDEWKANAASASAEIAAVLAKPLDLADLEAVLRVCAYIAERADDVRVTWDAAGFVALLTTGPSAYEANEYVGDERCKTDPIVCGRWIVGQVLSCIASGMPPHPVTTTFVERWTASYGNQ